MLMECPLGLAGLCPISFPFLFLMFLWLLSRCCFEIFLTCNLHCMGQTLSDFPSHSPVCLSESLKNFFLAAPLNLSADIVIGNLALKTCQSGGYGRDWLRKESDTRRSSHLRESTSTRTWLSTSSAVFLQSRRDIFKPWMYLTEFNMAMLRMQESFKIQLFSFLGIWEFRKLIPMIFF